MPGCTRCRRARAPGDPGEDAVVVACAGDYPAQSAHCGLRLRISTLAGTWSDAGENAVQRPGHPVQIHGAGQQARIAVLVAGPAAHEAAELVLRGPAPLSGLVLQVRSDLSSPSASMIRSTASVPSALISSSSRSRVHTKSRAPPSRRGRPGTDPGPPQRAPEVVLLGSVAEPGQPDVEPARTIPLQVVAEVRCAVHRDDGDAVGGEVTAAPLGQHLKRDPVAHPLDQKMHDDFGPALVAVVEMFDCCPPLRPASLARSGSLAKLPEPPRWLLAFVGHDIAPRGM